MGVSISETVKECNDRSYFLFSYPYNTIELLNHISPGWAFFTWRSFVVFLEKVLSQNSHLTSPPSCLSFRCLWRMALVAKSSPHSEQSSLWPRWRDLMWTSRYWLEESSPQT